MNDPSKANRRWRERRGGYDRDDLSTSMGRLAIGVSSHTQTPPLSAFVFANKAVAGTTVVVGEPVSKAKTIPGSFTSTTAYLKAMQAHTQAEFEAFLNQAVATATRLEGEGWLPVTAVSRHNFLVDGRANLEEDSDTDSGHNFEIDPWSRHIIQFESKDGLFLVIKCVDGPSRHQAHLIIAPAQNIDGSNTLYSAISPTHVRSLGYAGPFFREYGSAARLLQYDDGNDLLRIVAAPNRKRKNFEGTFIAPNKCGPLDTSLVPLNKTQREAVMNLTGGLDIIVGPPGTGKSTTIWHIINSRVNPSARILVTCTRNQAVDSITPKVATFGVLVFGSKNRIGKCAEAYTIDGRMKNDVELLYWQEVVHRWRKASQEAKMISWFPGFEKMKRLEQKGCQAKLGNHKDEAHREAVEKRGKANKRWHLVLSFVISTRLEAWVESGAKPGRPLFRRIRAFENWKSLLLSGHERASRILPRLEALTRFRILTKTRVLICTVDSTERMLRSMKDETLLAADAVGCVGEVKNLEVNIDTAIMDEAACVLETAIPVILSLGVKNLTLVGDQHQLQPFSRVREDKAGRHHCRSLMERALDTGVPGQFLTTQYRMHPAISSLISSTFYDSKVVTAEETKLARKSRMPCLWIHVSGDETKHQGRGYSNPSEVDQVVKQARAACRGYGASAEVLVITFYNMQRRELEKEFKRHSDIKHISIASVDSCQGSEADVVIISTVRSGDPGHKLSNFMLDSRRVNVALSRAREECIIVGDKDAMRSGGGAMWRSIIKHFNSKYGDRAFP